MGEHHGRAIGVATKGRLRLAVLYAVRPQDLDLLRNEIRPLADLFELPIAGDYMPQIRSLEPELILVHLGSLPSPVDVAFVRRLLGNLRGQRKLIVVGNRDLLGATELAFDLVGHVVYDDGIGDAAIRMLTRRNLTFLDGFRRKIGQISSNLDRMIDLGQNIAAQHAEMRSLDCNTQANAPPVSQHVTMTDDAVTLADFSLDIIGSLSNALGDEFSSLEYFHILMYLHRSRLVGRPEVSLRELCDLLDGPYSTTVRRVDELARKSHLRKSADPADKRRINVEIASPTIAIVERFLQRLTALTSRLQREPHISST